MGEKLSRAQVTIVNALYVISAVSVIAAHSNHNYESLRARHHAHFAMPDVAAAVDPALLTLIPASLAVINVSLIVSSLYFMWSIRHPGMQ